MKEAADILEAVIDRLWDRLLSAKPTDNYRFLYTILFQLEDELKVLRKDQ